MDSLTARSGRRGTVRASGVIELEGARLGHYAFALAMRDFTAVEPGFYAIEFDAPRLRVTDGIRVKGRCCRTSRARCPCAGRRVLYDFLGNQSETQQLAVIAQQLFWTYRIHMIANNNLRWQPPDGDIEFSADLTLEQTDKELKIFGTCGPSAAPTTSSATASTWPGPT